MRSTLRCVLLVAAARAANAQERVVTFEDEAPPLTVSGFAVGLARYDRDAGRNTAVASKLALSLFRPWSDGLYLFAQLTTHLEGPDSAGAESETHVEIDNLIVSWTPPGASALNLSFGRFDAPLGFERDDEPLNLVPTHSFNFKFARPAKLTGAIARYTATPVLGLSLFAANGWNEEIDNNTGKTAGLRVQLLPTEGYAVGVNALYGPEEEGSNAHQRTLVTVDATVQPVSRLILGMEANQGWQREAGANVGWSGVAGTAFWRLARTFGVTVRGEVLRDRDGVVTGTPQMLRSLTISPWYFYREAQEGVFTNIEHTSFRLPAFALRPALRFDKSDQPFFEDATGNLVRANITGVLELVYVF